MRNPFLFEAEEFENESQFEDSFESFENEFESESDYEGDYESDYEGDYESNYESDYESDYEGDYETAGDYEAAGDFESDYEGDYEDESDYEIVRDHRSGGRSPGIPIVRPSYQRPVVRPAYPRPIVRPVYQRPIYQRPFYQRPVVRTIYQRPFVRPFYQRPFVPPSYRLNPQWWRNRGLVPPPYSYPSQYPYPRFDASTNPMTPSMTPPAYSNPVTPPPYGPPPTDDGASPPMHRRRSRKSIRILQALLNRVLGLNLPVDGIMSPETRNAIRSFMNRQGSPANGTASQPAAAPAEPAPVDPGTAAAAGPPDNAQAQPPEGEFDEFEFSEWETSPREPWRTRLGMRPKPQYLSFLILDNFGFNKFAVTSYHDQMLDNLVSAVEASLKTMQPIDLIRLVGHTDSTGDEKYNVGLGDNRARAVEAALRVKLKGLLGRVAIVVEPSPGETLPAADNRTREGRARNRRVEVYITSGGIPPPPDPPKKIKIFPTDLPPDPIIKTKPSPYWKPVPTLPPGKTFKQWFFEQLSAFRIPKRLHNAIWNAFLDKDSGVLSKLLGAAGIDGSVRKAFMETARALSETPTR